jgi:hypothetical protein
MSLFGYSPVDMTEEGRQVEGEIFEYLLNFRSGEHNFRLKDMIIMVSHVLAALIGLSSEGWEMELSQINRTMFLSMYHSFQTQDPEEAKRQAESANERFNLGDDFAVAVHFEGLGYCVMLRSAITHLLEGCIVEDAEIVDEKVVLKGKLKDD